jgi:hypothetical protein
MSVVNIEKYFLKSKLIKTMLNILRYLTAHGNFSFISLIFCLCSKFPALVLLSCIFDINSLIVVSKVKELNSELKHDWL